MKARLFFIMATALMLVTSTVAQTREFQVYKGGNVIKFFHINDFDSVKVVYTAKNLTAQAIDLGLSVKWADVNVGAGRPEDYGQYFAWGETATKRNYDWSTYIWCEGSETTITKYCNDGSYGIEDNQTELEPADDVVRTSWGGAWRMPTASELDELNSNCTWTWVTQNGVNGQLVTGPNGNSIFLPANGGWDRLSFASRGSSGYYWSSSLGTQRASTARAIYLNSSDHDLFGGSRKYGFAVRPVLPATALAKAPELRVFKGEDLIWSIPVSEIDSAKIIEIPIHAVDLGVSVFWADVNVGAGTPEEYGNYYAWGETTPKDTYSLPNYKWWDEIYTKYCNSDQYGTTDYKGILEPSDDAATANWGGTWRMPTIEEISELCVRCHWDWTTRNGVAGFQVTGSNGNSIFLPAAGYINGADSLRVNSHGLYWSSSLKDTYVPGARYLFMNNDYIEYHGIDVLERFNGFPIRPVIKIH